MAEEQHSENAGGEIKDRGIFDFLSKKEEAKPQEEVIAAEFEKVHVSESHEKKEDEKEEKPCLTEKLHRSDSSGSSSSSDEEEGEGGEKKKKKKKGLKEKLLGEKKEEEKQKGLKEKILGEKKEEEKKVVETEDVTLGEATEEKKGFLEKIKEKLPGAQHKKAEDSHDSTVTVATECSGDPHGHHAGEEAKEKKGPLAGEEAKEKKGLLEKIKEKLPGYHKTEEKEETAHH